MKKPFASAALALMLLSFPTDSPTALARDCAPAQASLSLQSQLIPEDGLLGTSWQLASQLAGQIPWSLIEAGFEKHKPTIEDLEILRLHHGPENYGLELVIHQWFLWDQLQLLLDFPAANRLRLSLKDNWIPSELILDRLEARLKTALAELPLTLERKPQALEISLVSKSWQAQGRQFTLTNPQLQGQIEADGRLRLQLTADKPVSEPQNQLGLSSDVCADLQGLQADTQTEFSLQLPPEQIQQISLGSEKLIERLQNFKGRILSQSQVRMGWEPLQLQAEGQLHFELEQLEIEGKSYQGVTSVPFSWRYSLPDQFEIYPQLPVLAAIQPRLQPAGLKLFTDGPAYFADLQEQLLRARESIEQEVFSFDDGVTTRRLVRLYLLKALGLRESDQGLHPDNYAPQGLELRLLHNHHLTRKGVKEVSELFARQSQEIFEQLSRQGYAVDELRGLQNRLNEHLQISPLADGVAWTDHRKLLIIDGRLAYTGGRNTGDAYFSQDAFHDQMLRVSGPLVRDLHQAFIDNWHKLRPGQEVDWKLKSPAELQQDLPAKPALAAVLTTSHQAWQIESALLQLINQAQQTIRLEHAYIYHEPIEAALRAAKARGVEIQLLFSERSDESLFDLINPGTALKLMQAPGPGKVRTWLYRDPGGENNYMVHTKFLSVDGQKAIAGSANLIPRSLHSPFSVAGQPLLFNEELVLLIDDARFVQQMDQELFIKDQQSASQEFSAAELKALIQKRGGPLQLLIERLKGLLT